MCPVDGTKSLSDEFSKKYNDESSDWARHSGAGSLSYHTIDYRAFVEKFIRMNHLTSVVDIGCGDWQFSRFIDFDGVRYLGFDLVESVIDSNKSKYQRDNIEFKQMPETIAEVPGADLLIMKDVLQHLSNDLILQYKEFLFPRFQYCLLTNSFLKLDTPRNNDIASGAFRCLDLTAAPFRFTGVYVLEFGSSVWERIRTLLYDPMRT